MAIKGKKLSLFGPAWEDNMILTIDTICWALTRSRHNAELFLCTSNLT